MVPLLDGLRVVEVATGVAGPFAGRLLAMLGATVVKIEPPGGDPTRRQPVDDVGLAPTCGSPLFSHLNAGKRNVTAHMPLADAVEWADVIVDDQVRGERVGSVLDPDMLRKRTNPVVLVSVTAWGVDAERSEPVEHELLVQAAAGAMTLTGDADGPPLRLPGWQSQYLAGAYAAAGALALLSIRSGFLHLDVSWLGAMATGVEASFQQFLARRDQPKPDGPHPPTLFPSGALPCADGYVVPGTVRLSDWERQCHLYGMPQLLTDERFATRPARRDNWRELWDVIQPWYSTHTKDEIFRAGLDSGWAVGKVMSAVDALHDAHLGDRRFLGVVKSPEGDFVAPIRPFISPGTPIDQTLSGVGDDDEWFSGEIQLDRRSQPSPHRRVDELRVVELTTAWAGPFVGRFLGALGADVVKVESAMAFDLWRGPVPVGAAMRDLPDDTDPDQLSHNVAARFNAMNRNKRGCTIDISTELGRDVFLRLISHADVLIVNLAARVLPKLGLGDEVLRRHNDALIVVKMPALGASGPYRDAVGYGSIIEGMGGLAARFGYKSEGARVSQIFYPDPVAGVHASVAVLAALIHRNITGVGVSVDLSQQETLWLQFGEDIVFAARNGRDPARLQNAEPGVPDSGIERDAADHWVARVGDRAETVNGYREAASDERLRWMLEHVVHPVSGSIQHLRLPIRVDGEPITSRRHAPLLNGDTADVLRDWLQLDDDEIATLERDGAIGGTPRPTAAY